MSKPAKNPLAVALGRMAAGKSKRITPQESDARRARAAHARSVKAAKAQQNDK